MGLTVLDAGVIIGFLDANDTHHVVATAAQLDADHLITTDRGWPSRSSLKLRASIDKV